ncbi:maltokinase N-terminal cap-like domain-containing protein [Nostocoides veronense]|uniref:Maltokinase n=1 Tax=Nostocoides veronense TaxID=330836 RepID=A0ABP4XZ38_9MICO
MATIHTGANLVPSKQELIAGWIGEQRWYAAKGRAPQPRRLFSWRLDDPDGEVGIETLIVADDATTPPVIYQVPLTYRAAPLEGATHALVGTLEHSVLGTRYVYDGPHDPAYAERLFALATGSAQAVSSTVTDAPEESIHGTGAHAGLRLASSRVLTGEQSNTSIIAIAVDDSGAERPVITKVFRAIADGDNPDVILQGALAAAGCERVPASLGAVAGSWPSGDGEELAHGHLAFAQEFLPGAQDAWREALLAAGQNDDFTSRAADLGAATAEVHGILAQHLPTEPADSARVDQTIEEMRSRFRAALAEVPALAEHTHTIEATLAAAAKADWPAFQRVHGDYHLGQVLEVPERGWVLLDFEGEPLRPLAERNRTDQPLRDVAGMLRSFDYAGGSIEQQTRGVSARDWVSAAQDAFLDGYARVAGHDPRDAGPLLAAYIVDKALYEVVYEARNRPTWMNIPLAAIHRLLPAPAAPKED